MEIMTLPVIPKAQPNSPASIFGAHSMLSIRLNHLNERSPLLYQLPIVRATCQDSINHVSPRASKFEGSAVIFGEFTLLQWLALAGAIVSMQWQSHFLVLKDQAQSMTESLRSSHIPSSATFTMHSFTHFRSIRVLDLHRYLIYGRYLLCESLTHICHKVRLIIAAVLGGGLG